MYDLNDLLQLVVNSKADKLLIRIGQSPILTVTGEDECVEGPPVTVDNALELFNRVAPSRERREIWKSKSVEFIRKHTDGTTFRILACEAAAGITMVFVRLGSTETPMAN